MLGGGIYTYIVYKPPGCVGGDIQEEYPHIFLYSTYMYFVQKMFLYNVHTLNIRLGNLTNILYVSVRSLL